MAHVTVRTFDLVRGWGVVKENKYKTNNNNKNKNSTLHDILRLRQQQQNK